MSSDGTTMLTLLDGIYCPEEIPAKGIPVIAFDDKPTFFLSNRKELIEQLIEKIHTETVGELLLKPFQNAKMFFYGAHPQFSADDMANILGPRIFSSVLFSLWLRKDNAAIPTFSLAWSESIEEDGTDYIYSVKINPLFDAKGMGAETEFGLDALLKTFTAESSKWLTHDHLTSWLQKKPKGLNRIQRTLEFISHARASSDLGMRMALYTVCLEALFSTSSAELSHKLAERCALFIGSSPSHRLEIFNLVKKAYTIRSKVLHGSVVHPTEELEALSVGVDDLLRSVFKKIYSHCENYDLFLDNDPKFDLHFLNLLMGV